MERRDFLKRSLSGTALMALGVILPNNCLGRPQRERRRLTARAVSPISQSYPRTFPQLSANNLGNDAAGESILMSLGEKMRDDPNSRSSQERPPPMAGYTYLGQFINHDLSFDQTPLDQVRSSLATNVNLRTPYLDLDHLYGGGPNVSPFLYDQRSKRNEERFLLGETASSIVNGRTFLPTEDDLPRNSQGIALVGDPRQDENLIIAQLHVAFLKLHNRILNDLIRGEIKSGSGTLFEQAQRLATWHYQWVVRYDYLRQILAPEIFAQIPTSECSSGIQSPTFQIPVEYHLAAGRFGHSMVRDRYFINDIHPDANLREDLFHLTGAGGGACPRLPADWVISWERFFFVGSGSGLVRHSQAINTRLAEGLHQPDYPGAFSLPLKTLLRGSRAGLPSGQEMARVRGFEPLTPGRIAEGQDAEFLVQSGYDKATPLWYYILKEAEITADGAHLGLLGSKLVADVIMASIASDPRSYHSINPDWMPTLPGPEDPQFFGMPDLLRFATKGYHQTG